MFHNSFTGNSRRPRQVNLSGRNNPNPFAQAAPRDSSSAGISPGIKPGLATSGRANALANAQQDRLLRQQERQRAQAATLVQKTWRGNVVRRDVRAVQRRRWDEVEDRMSKADVHGDVQMANNQMTNSQMTNNQIANNNAGNKNPWRYDTDADALSQLWMLLRFVDLSDSGDFARLERHFARLKATRQDAVDTSGPWPAAYLRLEQTCLCALERMHTFADNNNTPCLVEIVHFVAQRLPPEAARYDFYYEKLANILQHHLTLNLITAPLQNISSATPEAYKQFSLHILTLPTLFELVGGEPGLSTLAASVNCRMLGSSLAESVRTSSQSHILAQTGLTTLQRSWLLGYFIYFYRHMYNFAQQERYSSDKDFVLVVGILLSSLADQVEIEPAFSDADNDAETFTRPSTLTPFIRDQITSLVNQESIGSLLSLVDNSEVSKDEDKSTESNHSRILASYILTLLRLFPRRGDEIRMWLYMGMSSRSLHRRGTGGTGGPVDKGTGIENNSEPLPVIKYFWQATANTHVYDAITQDPRAAIRLLRPRQNAVTSHTDTDDQWRVVLIFIELYMFVLKVMDDEEFFGGRNSTVKSQTLNLGEVQHLTIFLKHLGFTMYYNASDILRGPDDATPDDSTGMFRPKQLIAGDGNNSEKPHRSGATHIAGVQGMSLDYVKGLVTGLLRALYERDSRRPFLPKNHWLMTSRFDMNHFIDAVAEEEERRHQVQDEDDEDYDDDLHDSMDQQQQTYRLIGTSHTQRLRATERLQREQRKASRKRYLQAVAPRLEILQNMPFLIPFTTRVKIFRRFVYMDQRKRRLGVIDGEMWRLQQLNDPTGEGNTTLARHHAKIRREHEFDDAFEQFNDLGVGLKEPIHITFVDQFDAVEAGIDGGGVTKEFLTSVTNQAFAASDGIPMFVENDQHLLYPNPSAVEEQKLLLREAGFKENSSIFRAQVQDLLQRYEFLGRIIGKCLYEGILIDVGFASFFLLKWALTGGTGAAPRESGYRANLNDLRDFDEGLYQGLLQLKNYPGNVEDFSLNFTVTDTLSIPGTTKTKTITRDLKPGGSSIPVTNANRLVYISYMARHRLQSQPYLQSTAFLRGLAAIIQPSWLSMFNQSELQTLVGGAASQINIPDLRANTIYGGVYTIGDDGLEHYSVQLFWQVMESLDEDDRRKVLKFVTSTPRAPLLGFGSLNPRFSIRDSGGDETRLPSTSTCVNLLKLPRYSDLERCRAKLLQAVNSGAGFDLS